MHPHAAHPSQPIFKALADPTRREILCLLRDNDLTIAEVAQNFDMTRAAVKKHLTILSDGDLIKVETRGRERVNQIKPQTFQQIFDWLSYFDQFWDKHLSALKDVVEEN